MKKLLYSIFILFGIVAIAWALSGTSDEYITGKWTFKVTPKFEDLSATGTYGLVKVTSGQPSLLTPGSSGKVVQSDGTTQSYIAKNIYRRATIHNFATLAASWTLSADELLCRYLAATNANAAVTARFAASDGQTYTLRNASGQALTVYGSSGSGFSITNGKSATFYYDSTIGDFYKVGSEY